jgi:tRNA pseudouridine38-40 synthase
MELKGGSNGFLRLGPMSDGLSRNVKLTVEYDGTNYLGWQRQPQGMTVQQALEGGIEQVVGHHVRLYGSGRTDAGVHALGQVANFRTSSGIPAERFHLAINRVIPDDIVVLRAEDVALDFHARYSAKRKTYRYSIVCRPVRLAVGARYVHWLRRPLDVERMRAAAAQFLGEHDFAAFAKKRGVAIADWRSQIADCNSEITNLQSEIPWGKRPAGAGRWTVRTVSRCDVEVAGERIDCYVASNGFLYNMVRAMVGTLIEVGQGKRPAEQIRELLASGAHCRQWAPDCRQWAPRRLVGRTAPAKGLCLMSVEYE